MNVRKELHKHNSIPNYEDMLDKGCVICVRNAALAEVEKILDV